MKRKVSNFIIAFGSHVGDRRRVLNLDDLKDKRYDASLEGKDRKRSREWRGQFSADEQYEGTLNSEVFMKFLERRWKK